MIAIATDNHRIPLARHFANRPAWPLIKNGNLIQLVMYYGKVNGKDAYLRFSASYYLCIRHNDGIYNAPLWNKVEYSSGDVKGLISIKPAISTDMGGLYEKLPGICPADPASLGGITWEA